MSGWIIALIIAVVLFGVGAVFCAPWSPVHKKIEAGRNQQAFLDIKK